MITAKGEILIINPQTNSSLFSAALCSLGALGVITRITLKVQNAFLLRAYQEGIKFDTLINNFEQLAASADHVRIHWFPLTEDCVIWRASKTVEVLIPHAFT